MLRTRVKNLIVLGIFGAALATIFQNCADVDLLHPKNIITDPEINEQEQLPTPAPVIIDEGDYGPPPGYGIETNPNIGGHPIACGADGCSLSVLGGSAWIGARDTNTQPINISLVGNQYISFYFTTPAATTSDAKMGYLSTRVGTNTLTNDPRIIYTISKNRGQIQTNLDGCTNLSHSAFLNWSLGDNGRSDTCHLLPETKYYLNVAQRNSLDPNAQICTESCNTKISKNLDKLIVNEGFEETPSCQYQPSDPIFSHETLIRRAGTRNIDSNPSRYAAESIFASAGDDGRFRSGGTFWTTIRIGKLTALKFRTPAFNDESIGFGTFNHAMSNGSVNFPGWNPTPSPQVVSISQCPGDFNTHCTSTDLSVYASGFNQLFADGRYMSDPSYVVPNQICILKPDTDYYLNFKVPDGVTLEPGIDSVQTDHVFYGEGKLWIVH